MTHYGIIMSLILLGIFLFMVFLGALGAHSKESRIYEEPFSTYWDYIWFPISIGEIVGTWLKDNGPKKRSSK